MYFFDLHCDTITRLNTGERLEPGDRSLRRNGAHIDLERMEGLSWCQCFAVFMPDGLRGRAAIDYYEQSLRFFRTQLAENKDRIVQVRTADEILAAVKDGKCAALLTVEGGSVLAGEPSRAAELAADGVRMLTLTWNGENELGSGADMPGGLTRPSRRARMRGSSLMFRISTTAALGRWPTWRGGRLSRRIRMRAPSATTGAT